MHGNDKAYRTPSRSGVRLIALELNELCPALLDRFMGEGLLPNFSKLHRQSAVFVTEADTSDPAQLEPWIQWYSIHTGKSFDEHRVFHLTEGPRAGHDDIFQLLIRAGRKVMSFASMNVAPFAVDGSIFVGDPWSENSNAHPPELNVYNRFVSHNVREYSNAAGGLGMSDYARFLKFMASHGLSARAVARIVSQLARERIVDKQLSWQRVALLDQLQFDVFRSYYQRYRPDFATFFANSVAHLQHSYWRHMEPDAFQVTPDVEERAIYGDAIRFGYRAMDRLMGDFMKLADQHGARLMFITALSQQPFLRYEALGGQHFHRLHHVEKFLDGLSVSRAAVSPTMTHQYLMQCGSPEAARAARARLEALRLEDGRGIFGFPDIESEPDAIYFGCQIATATAPDSRIVDRHSNAQHRFGDHFYRIEAIKSGCHHPDGCLWIQTGSHSLHAQKRSILEILSAQLEMMGVRQPAGHFAGDSLGRLVAA